MTLHKPLSRFTPHLRSMKSLRLLPLALVLSVYTAQGASTEMYAVAEKSSSAATPVSDATSLTEVFLVDGGYIEAGAPFAGESPPSSDAVHKGLVAAVERAGFSTVAAPTKTSLILTYHWGCIRPDHNQPTPILRIQPNRRARLALVAHDRTVRKADEYFRGPMLPITDDEFRDAIRWAGAAKYFVVVSAYALTNESSQHVRLWRTRLSADDSSGPMYEVIAALLAAAPPYLARDLDKAERVEIPQPRLPPPKRAKVSVTTAAALGSHFERMLRREHNELAGEIDPNYGN